MKKLECIHAFYPCRITSMNRLNCTSDWFRLIIAKTCQKKSTQRHPGVWREAAPTRQSAKGDDTAPLAEQGPVFEEINSLLFRENKIFRPIPVPSNAGHANSRGFPEGLAPTRNFAEMHLRHISGLFHSSEAHLRYASELLRSFPGRLRRPEN